MGAVVAEHLHAVVARVGDGDHPACRGVCGALRRVELPVAGAKRSELACERTVGPKDLHAVVARVGDGDHSLQRPRRRGRRRKRDIARLLKVDRRSVAAPPKLADGRAVGGAEQADTVVTRVSDGNQVA